jgi:hypothetical protein
LRALRSREVAGQSHLCISDNSTDNAEVDGSSPSSPTACTGSLGPAHRWFTRSRWAAQTARCTPDSGLALGTVPDAERMMVGDCHRPAPGCVRSPSGGVRYRAFRRSRPGLIGHPTPWASVPAGPWAGHGSSPTGPSGKSIVSSADFVSSPGRVTAKLPKPAKLPIDRASTPHTRNKQATISSPNSLLRRVLELLRDGDRFHSHQWLARRQR